MSTEVKVTETALRPASADLPMPRIRQRTKPRFPLVLKLFLVTALLIAAVVGLAIGITLQRASSIATQTVDKAISGAGSLFEQLERRRLKELSLGVLTLSRDSYFYAYVDEALGAAAEQPAASQAPAPAPTEPAAPKIDTASVLDQLVQRQKLLGSDLVILTDDQGYLVARTDVADITGMHRDDLYEQQPLLKNLIDNPPAPDPASGATPPVTGTMLIGGKLYHAAAAPLSVGGKPPVAYLINAYAIDDRFATQIASATSTSVIFIPARQVAGFVPPRSPNAPDAENIEKMTEVQSLLSTAKMMPPHTANLGGSSYVLTGEPLMANGNILGAAVIARSLDTELAPFRRIERTLFLAGGLALLLAFVLSWLVAKRLTRPIEDLADIAQSVTEGDLSVSPDVNRSDEVGILASSFASMITALRDKAELEQLYAAMSDKERDRAAAPAALYVSPRQEEGTVLVTDLRGAPTATSDGDAATVIATIADAMKLQEAEIRRYDGEVRDIVGTHLVAFFDGDRAVVAAIRAARGITEELTARSRKEQPLTIGAGIASGEFVSGSVQLSIESGVAVVGNAPTSAWLFAQEAPAGNAFLSTDSAQAVSPELLSASHREEVRLRWLPAPLHVVAVPLQMLTTGVMSSVGTGVMQTIRLDGGGTTGAGSVAGPRELSAGETFARRYQIEQVVGKGGMGVVYRAVDTQLDETVAIKTLNAEALGSSPEQLERFKREIRLARRITHRNVLRTFDYGEADGVYFISMEYVRGYTLAELLEETRQLAPRPAVGLTRQICRGLQAAHEQGIIHRDIKPQNVLVDGRGDVKLMDFGIARMAEAPEQMTQQGLIVGTPHYMSPEQVQGKTLDPRSDVYSMGVLMYEMLGGTRPFESSSLMGVLTAHVTETARPLRELRADVPRDIEAIVMRCLAKNPNDRFVDAGELLRALDRLDAVAAA